MIRKLTNNNMADVAGSLIVEMEPGVFTIINEDNVGKTAVKSLGWGVMSNTGSVPVHFPFIAPPDGYVASPSSAGNMKVYFTDKNWASKIDKEFNGNIRNDAGRVYTTYQDLRENGWKIDNNLKLYPFWP